MVLQSRIQIYSIYILNTLPMKPLTKNSKETVFCHVLETIGIPDLSITSKICVQKVIKNFCNNALGLWQKSSRNSIRFRNQNKE